MQAGIETHTMNTHQRSLEIDVMGLAAVHSVMTGKSPVTSLLHFEPTLGKAWDSYQQSDTALGIGAGLSNTALSAYNAKQAFSSMDRRATSLSRYGIGDETGFNPTVSLIYTDSRTSSSFQTLSGAGVQRGSWEVLVDYDFTLDGLPVDIKQNMNVKATNFTQNGVVQESSSQTTSVSLSVSGTVNGTGLNAGVGYQTGHTHDQTVQPQILNVGGQLTLDVDRWEINGAITTVNDIGGSVRELQVTSMQNKSSNDTLSLNASTTGNVGMSMSHHMESMTGDVSGLHVTQGLESDLQVERTILNGGLVDLPPDVNVSLGVIETHAQKNKASGYRVGFFANVNNFVPHEQADDASSKQISSMGVDYAHHNYHDTQTGTVGAEIERTISVNSEVNVHFDVPLSCPQLGARKQEGKALDESEVISSMVESDVSDLNSIIEANTHDSEVSTLTTYNASVFEQTTPLLPEVHLDDPSPSVASLGTLNEVQDEVVDSSTKVSSSADDSSLYTKVDSLTKRWGFTFYDDTTMPKLESTGFEANSNSVETSYKNGGGGKSQLFLNESGKYTTRDTVEKLLVAPYEPDRTPLFTYKGEATMGNYMWRMNKDWFLRPTLVVNLPTLEYQGEVDWGKTPNTYKSQAGLQVTAGFRCNLVSGTLPLWDIGELGYAIDAVSASASGGLTCKADNGIVKFDLSGEAGYLGPNGGLGLKTNQLNLLLFTLKVQASASVGFGHKVGGGIGGQADLETFKFRFFFKESTYYGVGQQAKFDIDFGINPELPNRVEQIGNEIANHPKYKDKIQKYYDAFNEADTRTIKSSNWGMAFVEWCIKVNDTSTYLELLTDTLDNIGDKATATAIFEMLRNKPTVSKPNENVRPWGAMEQLWEASHNCSYG